MTNDSRDLDCACAEAMGWTTKEFSSATALVRGKELVWQPPRYSTDPSTQAEKLAWFKSQGLKWNLLGYDDDKVLAQSWRGGLLHELDRALGTTIDEALARLICCVQARPRGEW